MATITSKELSAICDLMSVEQSIVAKYKTFAQQSTDSTLKNQYEQLAHRHQRHLDQLYSNLK